MSEYDIEREVPVVSKRVKNRPVSMAYVKYCVAISINM